MTKLDHQSTSEAESYRPLVSQERVKEIKELRQAMASQGGGEEGEQTHPFLGLTLRVPSQVMTPCPVSPMLGGAVFAEVEPGDRVLDMGTGSGSLALIAAKKGADVLAVDLNPHAVAAVRVNAELNGVADLVESRESDVFNSVEGRFDLIVFNPPFQWFAATDYADVAGTDAGYQALTRFFREARAHLTEKGRMILFFSTMGDVEYFEKLVADEGFDHEVVFSTTRPVFDVPVEFTVHRVS
ncbi:methyltransferase [Streptomyces sp. A3M-1-3]|uniref:HemK2/MTQ2 family protein methyltransferase n=1 Tax=Streptomyces sp. A3M-1-3 TaxID=2962044 RepID=UPI0020B73FA3|nr:HemK2/MTQ2 family protein methyltransferase [Streptomyces sp. A3M-1-3]MCP3819284.1 methyltransferase [Streptomyces sp. A3M-1-3]